MEKITSNSFFVQEEVARFLQLLEECRRNKGCIIAFDSASIARNYRRKFYRLRQLEKWEGREVLQEYAKQLTFKLQGRRIHLIPPASYAVSTYLTSTESEGNTENAPK